MNKKKIKIIFVTYHYLKRQDEFNRIWGHDFSLFKKHIKFYKKNYLPINPQDFFDFMEGKDVELPERCSVISFDDSLKEQSKIIAPYLNKLDIRAIYNISPCVFHGEPLNSQIIHFSMAYYGIRNFVKQVKDELHVIEKDYKKFKVFLNFNKDILSISSSIKNFFNNEIKHEEARKLLLIVWEKYMLKDIPDAFYKIHMDKNDVINLHKQGNTIGLHSYSHSLINDNTFNKELFSKEIKQGKEALEEVIRSEVDCFGYPYGFKEDVLQKKENIDMLSDIGLKYLFTVYDNKKFEPNFIGRYSSQGRDKLSILKNNIWEYEISNN